MLGGLPLSVAVGGSTVFSPSSISGMLLWVDSETNVSGDGLDGGIDSIGDQSGNSNDLTATAPNRPVLASGDFASGAKPGIFFPDVATETDFLSTPSAITFSSGFGMCVVFKTTGADTTTTTTGNSPMTLFAKTASGRLTWGLSGATNAANAQYHHKPSGTFSSVATTGKTLNDGNVHIVCLSHNASSGAITMWVDNASAATGTITYNTAAAIDTIGLGISAGDQVDDFSVAELILWNNTLSSTDASNLYTYGAARWT